MTSEGLGEMFEGDFADTSDEKFPLLLMGVWAEGLACVWKLLLFLFCSLLKSMHLNLLTVPKNADWIIYVHLIDNPNRTENIELNVNHWHNF